MRGRSGNGYNPCILSANSQQCTCSYRLSAAANLTRIQRPWLVTSCEWNDKLIRSAIVWLCQLTGKPILKLTNKDYNENGLSELLALFGSPIT